MQITRDPIQGVAILTGQGDSTNAAILSVRLPEPLRSLVPAIFKQFENDIP
jgi:hypothetical protein